MKKISYLKKLKLFFLYRKTLKKIQKELETSFNIRIDEAYRMYTVININDELISDDNYVLDSKYLESVVQRNFKEFTGVVSSYLNSKGLSELYDYYEITPVEKYSYLIVIGFSLFKTDEFYEKFYKNAQNAIGFGVFAIIFTLLLVFFLSLIN